MLLNQSKKMQKKLLLLPLLLLGIGLSSLPINAQNSDASDKDRSEETQDGDEKKKVVKKKKMRNVKQGVNELELFNGKALPRAKFYIYLSSASWCGPCRAELPHIVKAYPAMRKKGVEIIFVSHDQDQKSCEKFLEKFNATFPAVMVSDPGLVNLLGYSRAHGIPNAIFVDARGRIRSQGHGYLVKDWKKQIKKKPARTSSRRR